LGAAERVCDEWAAKIWREFVVGSRRETGSGGKGINEFEDKEAGKGTA